MAKAIIKKKKIKRVKISGGSDPFWGNTKSLLSRGAVTPFVSNFMTTQIFGVDPTDLARVWAEDEDEGVLAQPSPLAEVHNQRLHRVAQYYSVRANAPSAKSYYLNTLKGFLLGQAEDDEDVDPDDYDEVEENAATMDFSEMAYRLGYPKFADPRDNPLRLLAELPLPLYITTSHHNFLEVALSRANPPRQPVSEIFYWDDTLHHIPSIFDSDPDYQPSLERPLIYHLYGLDKYPESLVLTEDDYLDFLVRISSPEVRRPDQKHSIPESVTYALAGTPLLLLGYEVYEWEFRILFRGLIRAMNDSRANNSNVADGFSMQIEPGQDHKDPLQVREYLDKYFEQFRFKVYWGDANRCVQALYNIWKG